MARERTSFEQIVEYHDDGIVVTDNCFRITYTNSAAAQLFQSNSISACDYLFDLFSAEEKPQLTQQLTEIYSDNKNGNPLTNQLYFNFPLPNSLSRQLKIIAKHFQHDRNQRLFVIPDCTELANLNSELARTKTEFTFAQQVAKLGIWKWDIETGEIEWSDQSYRLLGWEPGTMRPTAELFLEKIHRDDRTAIQQQMEKMLNRESYDPIDYRIHYSDSEIRYLHSIPAKPDHFPPKVVYGTVQDVTHRKTAELRLQQLFRELDIITRSIPDIVFTTDIRGQITWANDNFFKLVGNESDQNRATQISDFVSGNDLDEFRARLAMCAAFKQCDLRVKLNIRNEERVYHLKFAALDATIPCEIIVVGRDINDYEILQTRLQQSQKMEALGHFTGGIAHDFNNILSVIIGFTALAKINASAKSGKVEGYLDEVYSAAERARDLIKKLLTFSRGTMGTPVPLNLRDKIQKTVSLLKSILPASIELRLENFESDAVILIDNIQLEHIVMNLCLNAKDAMNGKGVVTIRLNPRVAINEVCSSCHALVDDEYVTLEIEDSGHGVSEDSIGRIFEPFYTTKPVGKGSGLGLAMVHGIMHEHKGHIIVRSEPGRGSVFRLLFPVVTTTQIA